MKIEYCKRSCSSCKMWFQEHNILHSNVHQEGTYKTQLGNSLWGKFLNGKNDEKSDLLNLQS